MSNIQLINADCLELLHTIPTGSVDMILNDLPYGTISCKWDNIIPFEPMWKELERVIKPNGAMVFFASQPFTSALVMSNPKLFRYSWIWNKNKGTGHLNAKRMPMKYHEDILVFSKKPSVYYPQITTDHKPMNTATNKQNNINGSHGSVKTEGGKTTRQPRSVLDFKVVNNDGTSDDGRFHPSQKPLDMLEYIIKTYTKETETVLDITFGSGSTALACSNINRNFIGFEKEREYFEIAYNRIYNKKKTIEDIFK